MASKALRTSLAAVMWSSLREALRSEFTSRSSSALTKILSIEQVQVKWDIFQCYITWEMAFSTSSGSSLLALMILPLVSAMMVFSEIYKYKII